MNLRAFLKALKWDFASLFSRGLVVPHLHSSFLVCVCARVCVYVRACASLCVCVCVCVCEHVSRRNLCACVYMHTLLCPCA